MKRPSLIEVYNQTFQELLTLRKLHIRYAATYIANQSSGGIGTEDTEFMTCLQQWIDDTKTQML